MNHESADMTTNPSLLFRLRDVRDRNAWTLSVEVYGPAVDSTIRASHLPKGRPFPFPVPDTFSIHICSKSPFHA